MNIENIELNKPYKYKELCDVLSIEQKNCTGSKRSQLKQLELILDIIKNKTWYTINNIRETPLQKIELRGGNNAKDYTQYKVDRKYDKNIGVYSMISI